MNPRVNFYVGAVLLAAAVLSFVNAPTDLATRGVHYLGWIVICAFSEWLWVSTLSGEGKITMADTAGLASVMLWGMAPAMVIAMTSTAIADSLLHRKPAIRVAFNVGQIAITTWATAATFTLLGGPAAGFVAEPPASATGINSLRLLLPVCGAFVAYLLANRIQVAGAVALANERSYLRVLHEDYFYGERLLQDLAAFLLSPLMVISYQSVGYPGVMLFFAPLWLLNESAKRYIALQQAQDQMIHTERMAAKGELAAGIGHELRNLLATINGRAQFVMSKIDKSDLDGARRDAQLILEQGQRMEQLSRNLMEFSSSEIKLERIDVNGLLQRTSEFVKSQKSKFENVEWEFDLASPSPELRADPGQLQQVLLNLFMNAADAMRDRVGANGSSRKLIVVSTRRDERTGDVRIVVQDTGSGIPDSNLTRIFEPHFTTKKDGNGFGLATCYRIISKHRGKITAESPPGQGARFTITLPVGWN